MSLFFTFLFLLKEFIYQAFFSRVCIKQIPYEISNKKKLHNYAIHIVSCIAVVHAILRKKKLSKSERLLQTHLSYMAAIVDMEMDKAVIIDVASFLKTDSLASKIIEFCIQVLKDSSTLLEKDLQEYIDNGIEQQFSSLIQKEKKLITSEVKKLTWQKCGSAFLLSRLLFNEKIDKKEEQFYYQYGGLGQLGDDLLDIYDDKQEGITSLAHLMNLDDLEVLYNQELGVLFAYLKSLNYSDTQKKKVAKIISVVCSVPLLQFDNFKGKNIKFGNQFITGELTRKDTIVDMQSLKVVVLCYKQSKKTFERYFLANSRHNRLN